MRSDWKPIVLTAALLCGVVGLHAQAPAAPKPLPKFEDYRVAAADMFKGPAAPIVADRSKIAQTYRTRLRDGERKGPNFAGSFTLVSWGCGGGCQDWAVIDAKTGQVSDSMIRTSVGAEFKPDSRLLLVDTPKLADEAYSGKAPPNCTDCGTPSAYEWRDGKWQGVPGFPTSHVHAFK
jgi:hypothetical protein